MEKASLLRVLSDLAVRLCRLTPSRPSMEGDTLFLEL